MGAVIEQNDRLVRLSIARLAEEFGMARETVSKRLAQAQVQPDGKRNGYPVYRLRDACPALLEPAAYDEDGNPDPSSLPPDKRNSWYQSEIRRLEVEMKCGELIPAGEVEIEMADLVKSLLQFTDTLGDSLERDCGLTPEQVEAVHSAVAKHRASFYREVVSAEDQAAA